MVVGVEESSDIKMSDTAQIRLNGEWYRRNVYSDTKDPRRRDIFPPNIKGELPGKARVRWQGNSYTAELSFRTGRVGSRIPVYQFTVESPAKNNNRGGRV